MILLVLALGCGGAEVALDTDEDVGIFGPSCAELPARLAFGDVAVGESAEGLITVTNRCGPMYIDAVRVDGGGFTAELVGPAALAPGASTTVRVVFTPVAPGVAEAMIDVVGDDVGASQATWARGTGTGPALVWAAPEDARLDGDCGASASASVGNAGDRPLTITAITSDTFTIDAPDLPWTLPAGEARSFGVTVGPSATDVSGTIVVESDDPVRPRLEIPWIATQIATPGAASFTARAASADLLLLADGPAEFRDLAIADLGALFDALDTADVGWRLTLVERNAGEAWEGARWATSADAIVAAAAGDETEGSSDFYGFKGMAAWADDQSPSGDPVIGLVASMNDQWFEHVGDDWVGEIERYVGGPIPWSVVGTPNGGCHRFPSTPMIRALVGRSGGVSVDLCAVDPMGAWDRVADGIVDDVRGVALDSAPWVDTVRVTVDGAPTTAWRLGRDGRTLVVDAGPGAAVAATWLPAVCGG